jgi:predicted enzyme related to lactoylglutathione lyase
MIRGVQTMFYSTDAAATRSFKRDKLGLPFTDVGEGWLLLDLPAGDMGVHPADDAQPHARPGTHAISLFCDEIEQTVADLQRKGVEFLAPIEDHGYGLVTFFTMPGGITIQLYQPHYSKRS